MKIRAAVRLLASEGVGEVKKRFAVYLNNGYRFDLETVMDGTSIAQVRKEWIWINEGLPWNTDPKNFRVKDVTGKPGF